MHIGEEIVNELSSIGWSIFLPLVTILSIYSVWKVFSKVQKETTEKSNVKIKEIIGPVSISLGAMVGTGAVIGVLGSIASINMSGQNYIEAVMGWAILGTIILLPLSYIETLVAKITQMPPKEYIAKFLSPKMATIYAFSFATMYILGFGGFQFQGINSTITIVTENFFPIELSLAQRYFFIVIPLIIFVGLIVLTKKHNVFINAMSFFIGIAVFLYILFVVTFIFKTADYIPEMFSNMIEGMKNPVTSMIGIPISLIVTFQRIIQTSEPGLGALAMASLDSDSKSRPAGIISLGTSLVTILISIFSTTYIVSYGYSESLINLSQNDTLVLLQGFFATGYSVTGIFGVVIMIIFTLFSGITTILGSYYFLSVLFKMKENTQIIVYLLILIVAGTLAIFGGAIIFEIVDLLLFVVASINILAITIFVTKRYKDYKLDTKSK